MTSDLDRLEELCGERAERVRAMDTHWHDTYARNAVNELLTLALKGWEAAKERECCGNCLNLRSDRHCMAANDGQTLLPSVAGHCHFTPSRWTARDRAGEET